MSALCTGAGDTPISLPASPPSNRDAGQAAAPANWTEADEKQLDEWLSNQWPCTQNDPYQTLLMANQLMQSGSQPHARARPESVSNQSLVQQRPAGVETVGMRIQEMPSALRQRHSPTQPESSSGGQAGGAPHEHHHHHHHSVEQQQMPWWMAGISQGGASAAGKQEGEALARGTQTEIPDVHTREVDAMPERPEHVQTPSAPVSQMFGCGAVAAAECLLLRVHTDVIIGMFVHCCCECIQI